jgi:hypothetical protein
LVTVQPDTRDRSRYRRVLAPILVRPVGLLERHAPREVDDRQAGALRTYSDDRQKPGRRLELEILLPAGDSVTFLAEVAWVEGLPEGAPARFDVGLRYVRVSREDLDRIAQVLEAPEGKTDSPTT